LLLDFWPLGRRAATNQSTGSRLVLEKLPLFALAAASSVATWIAQRSAMHLTDVVPFGFRAQNAVVETFVYVVKTFWPSDLAVLYPFPRSIDVGLVAASALILVAISAFVVALARRRPWAAIGWFWFLGTLVPVIGLVQVGLHARADRYTYVPSIGLFVIAAWSAAEFVERRPKARLPIAALSCAVLVLCGTASSRQLDFWRDTPTLFRRACDVTTDNGWAHRMLANALAERGAKREAIPEYREALRIWSGDPIAHNNLGSALQSIGALAEAAHEYSEASRLDPSNEMYRRNLAAVRSRLGANR
jgi:hypothetical protein